MIFHSLRQRPFACLFCLCVALLPPAIRATDDNITQPADQRFTLTMALRRAESNHPLLQSYRAQLAAADARSLQAGQRPPPEVGLEIEDVFGSGRVSGIKSSQTTLSFSQLIERGGLRDRRLDVARADHAGRVTVAQIARLDLRAEVARCFVHVLADQALLDTSREATALARSTLDEVEKRVAAARAPLAESSRARVALARAELAEEHAEHELLSSRRHLAAATGSMETNFAEADGDLLTLPPVAPFETLLSQMQESPDFLRFANDERLRASELRLAQARRTPGIQVGVGIRRLEAGNDTGLVFSASMPLPSRTRESGNIAEAEARIAQVAPDREHAWLRAQAHLFELFQELNHAAIEFQARRDRILPAMDEALKQTRVAYERGRYSLLELRDAEAEWALQKRQLIEAASAYHQHLIEIQRLTGSPVPGEIASAARQP